MRGGYSWAQRYMSNKSRVKTYVSQALFEKVANDAGDSQQVQKQQQKQLQQRRPQQGGRKAPDAKGRAAAAAATGAPLLPSPDKALLLVQLELTKGGVTISPSKSVMLNKYMRV